MNLVGENLFNLSYISVFLSRAVSVAWLNHWTTSRWSSVDDEYSHFLFSLMHIYFSWDKSFPFLMFNMTHVSTLQLCAWILLMLMFLIKEGGGGELAQRY
jgi:hypothetical protein